MAVPEIDRLAHEILDILGGDPFDGERPKDSGRLLDRAFVTITRELRQVDSARKPFASGFAERLEPRDLGLQKGSPVWDYASRQFKRSPAEALLRLYAALERAEMQERATTTTHLATNQVTPLSALREARDDVDGHEDAEGTR